MGRVAAVLPSSISKAACVPARERGDGDSPPHDPIDFLSINAEPSRVYDIRPRLDPFALKEKTCT